MSSDMSLSQSSMWNAVQHRDERYDGLFFYGVLSTKIYCRPQCSCKKPNRENTVFFFSSAMAEKAGFRPCKRCEPDKAQNPKYVEPKVIEICRYIESCNGIPTLDELAQAVYLSRSHLQRLFKQTLGITPRDYAEACRQAVLWASFQKGNDLSMAIYDAGYGSVSRVYENVSQKMGMTPKAYQKRGAGQHITSTIVRCPLGWLLVASTPKGICCVQIGDLKEELQTHFKRQFMCANHTKADKQLTEWTQQLIDYLSGASRWPELPYDIQCTAFQKKVWNFLRTIPPGETQYYSEIAAAIGNGNATRAVASACASNPAALVIPCHRVVPKSGGTGNYRWGADRKKKLLLMEKLKPEGDSGNEQDS